MVAVVVTAPTPTDAATAVTALVNHGLHTTEALHGWTITTTEVQQPGRTRTTTAPPG